MVQQFKNILYDTSLMNLMAVNGEL